MDRQALHEAREPLGSDLPDEAFGTTHGYFSDGQQAQLSQMGFSYEDISAALRQLIASDVTPSVEQLVDVLLSEEFQQRVEPMEESPRSLRLARTISAGLSSTIPGMPEALTRAISPVSPDQPSFSLERFLSFNSNYGHRPRECPICFDVLREEETYKDSGCDHAYHYRCFSEHVRQKMLQGIDVITCPECPRIVDRDEARHHVSSLTADNYEKGLRDRSILQDPNRIFCPTPNCNNVLKRPWMETLVTVFGACILLVVFLAIGSAYGFIFANAFAFRDSLQLCFVSTCSVATLLGMILIRLTKPLMPRSWGWPVTCDLCQTCVCYRCKERWHPGCPCDNDARLELWAASHNAQQCPRCRSWIEFDTGCDHMKCRNCGHHFNWQSPVADSSDASGPSHFVKKFILALQFLVGSVFATEVLEQGPIGSVELVWCTLSFLTGVVLITSPKLSRYRILSLVMAPLASIGLALAWLQTSRAIGQGWPSIFVSGALYAAIVFAVSSNTEGAVAAIAFAMCQLVLISAGAGIAIFSKGTTAWHWLCSILAYPALSFVMFCSFFGNMLLLTLGIGLPMIIGFALALYTLGLDALYHTPIGNNINASVLYGCLGIVVGWYLFLKLGLCGHVRLPVPEVTYLVALVWIIVATTEFAVDAGWAKPNFVQATQAFFGLSAGLSAASSRCLRIFFGILGAAAGILLGWFRDDPTFLIVERYVACTIAAAAISHNGGIFLGRYCGSRFVDFLLRA